jgi:hypothetical protein
MLKSIDPFSAREVHQLDVALVLSTIITLEERSLP